MPLLSRNPFHHEHHNGSSQSPPPSIKSSKSFLGFISRKPSTDSLKSERSQDSLKSMNNTAASSYVHINESATASPKQSHSMAELKRFFRSSTKKSKTPLRSRNTSPTNSASPSTVNLVSHFNLGMTSKSHTNLHDMHRHEDHSSSSTTALSALAHKHQKHHHPHGSTDHHVHTQSAIPPTSDSILSLSNNINIYHDDSILAQKYGKLGKLLGSGAGGSVKILTRPSDGATFAVKEFRPRKPNESVKEYAKKCTAEFCIGSSLHHPNIVETVDVFSDSKQNKYYEVMQYCPVDFFAVVMTGKMSRGEINCCLKQLTEGVKYLHSVGLAHRDLKLDNCVMTADGILKLIDFGSAVVFRYPFEDDVTMAHGIVGSDPYLAPEVITSTKSYDPQAVDIWSIGIIYCCMMLKRFPWKAPRESDENFRLYCLPDEAHHDYVESAKHHEQLLRERREKKHKHETDARNGETNGTIIPSNLNYVEDASKVDESVTKVDGSKEKSAATYQGEKNDDVLPTPVATNDEHKKHEHPESVHVANEKPEVDDSNQKKENQNIEQTQSQDLKSIASHKPPHHKKTIRGPYRLLRLLPHASRPLVSRMLEVDPCKRATMKEICNDEWYSHIPYCTMDEKKNVIRAAGHHHTIVKEIDSHVETYKI
ncbi:Serine/threonine-protein kinase HRK1 [Nakaseomyces bracarensis]|uniref:non-specific serine/threonine protein kinase n=1 Tax=Nakaseomyces bracarensis TaxID=273131 RepID=A0ABR4NSI7_9SACH